MFSHPVISWLKGLINRTPPLPSFETVNPSGGPGWYRWQRGRWAWVEAVKVKPGDIFLTEDDLLRFALDAIVSLRKHKESKR